MLTRRARIELTTGDFNQESPLKLKIGVVTISAYVRPHYDGKMIREGGTDILVMEVQITHIPKCLAAISLVLKNAGRYPYVALSCPSVRADIDTDEEVTGPVIAYSGLIVDGLTDDVLDLAIRGLTHHFLELPVLLAHDPDVRKFIDDLNTKMEKEIEEALADDGDDSTDDDLTDDDSTDDEPPTLPEDDKPTQLESWEREERDEIIQIEDDPDESTESIEESPAENLSNKSKVAQVNKVKDCSKIDETLIARVLSDLDGLVGMNEVKSEVRSLVKLCRLNAKRAALGLKTEGFAPHLVFSGNPGTGKTTVARIIGDLYRALGILKKGHIIESDRSKLIGAYIGQTAIKTRNVCKKAHDGVLFIDEAYGLSDDNDGFGSDAIETILLEMENQRGNMAVVVAGYTEKMKEFIGANPGLRSRFDRVIEFADYSVEELVQIVEVIARKRDYYLDEESKVALRKGIERTQRGEGFGNGREARRWVDRAIEFQAKMHDEHKQYSDEELLVISAAAIDAVFQDHKVASKSKKIGFCIR
jgi:SpoVK/Ycf46/Vps4 family AAA+-type ATPase